MPAGIVNVAVIHPATSSSLESTNKGVERSHVFKFDRSERAAAAESSVQRPWKDESKQVKAPCVHSFIPSAVLLGMPVCAGH